MRWLGYGFLGFVAGAAVALGLCVLAGWIFAISQAEGAYAMQVAFIWIPAGALVGLVAGLVAAGRRGKS